MTSASRSMYRTAVAEDFPETVEVRLGERVLAYHKAPGGLRYGENPHQSAAYYLPAGRAAGPTWRKLGKGGASWTNLADIEHALRILKYFDDPAVAIMKHLNPAGVAVGTGDIYRAARGCDERAAFGGVAVFNRPLDLDTANAVLETFIEVVAAPGFTPAALAALEAKADLRVAEVAVTGRPRFVGEPAEPELKLLGDGSLLLQQPYLTRIRSTADLAVQPGPAPSAAMLADLRMAWYVCAGVRSNGVVLVKDGRTLAVGTGEQERVGAVEQAIAKARQKGHDLTGASCASDAFFPFRDAVDALAAAGVRAVVQPGGSLRDAEVLQAAAEHGIAIAFTGERCFAHF